MTSAPRQTACSRCGGTGADPGISGVRVTNSDLSADERAQLTRHLRIRGAVGEALDELLAYRHPELLFNARGVGDAILRVKSWIAEAEAAYAQGEYDASVFGLLQTAVEAIWIVEEYGYPLREDVIATIRAEAAGDAQT